MPFLNFLTLIDSLPIGPGLIGGILAEDPYKTTYKSLTDHSAPSKPEFNKTNSYPTQQQNDLLNDSRNRNQNQNAPILNEKVAFKYESQRTLGRSLISNIGSSVAASLAKDTQN